MQALPDTIQRERAGRGPMASPSVSPSFDDFQGGSSARGQSRGGCRCLPQIRPYQFQFAGADAPRQRPVQFHSSRCIGHHLPGRAFVAAPGLFHSSAFIGYSRSRAHTFPHQPAFKHFADVDHISRLSSVSGLVGIDPNENGLTHAQASFAPGAKAND